MQGKFFSKSVDFLKEITQYFFYIKSNTSIENMLLLPFQKNKRWKIKDE